MLRVESGDGEAEATVDGVGDQFIAFLLNVEDDALLRRSILHCFLALFTPVDDFVD